MGPGIRHRHKSFRNCSGRAQNNFSFYSRHLRDEPALDLSSGRKGSLKHHSPIAGDTYLDYALLGRNACMDGLK